jgi:hypothetical protein
MKTYPRQLEDAKNAYYRDLLVRNGSPQGIWEFLQMKIGVKGPPAG